MPALPGFFQSKRRTVSVPGPGSELILSGSAQRIWFCVFVPANAINGIALLPPGASDTDPGIVIDGSTKPVEFWYGRHGDFVFQEWRGIPLAGAATICVMELEQIPGVT